METNLLTEKVLGLLTSLITFGFYNLQELDQMIVDVITTLDGRNDKITTNAGNQEQKG